MKQRKEGVEDEDMKDVFAIEFQRAFPLEHNEYEHLLFLCQLNSCYGTNF
jgi:hypothetical protein